MSTRVEGGTALILVTAHATLSAGSAHLLLTVREGPASGTWRYNLAEGLLEQFATGADENPHD